MDKDTEASLLAFYGEVRSRKEKMKEYPEGDPKRSTLLNDYLAGKAEYNRRKDAFQQSLKGLFLGLNKCSSVMLISSSKTVLGGEASTSTPVNVEPIGRAEPLTTGEASVTSHRGNISPKLESL